MAGIDVAVVGSLNLDVVARVRRHPRPGETVLASEHFENPGGKGANQAVAAARMGSTVAMIGRVGADAAGRQLLDALDRDGVDTAAVATSDAPTGIALIAVDDEGENTIVVSPGANQRLTPDDVHDHAALLAGAAVCLIQVEIPDAAVRAAVGCAGGTVVLNPAPARAVDGAVLDGTAVLVPNAGELATLVDDDPADDIDAVATQVRRLPFDGIVVVTLGRDGALVVDRSTVTHVPAPAVDVVDTTAAGDAFCGGLADALARGATVRDAVRWAALAGAHAATIAGAQRSLPRRAEVERLASTSSEG